MNDLTEKWGKTDRPDLGKFFWEDPLLLDSQLTEEELMLKKSVKSFADEKLKTRVIEA